MPFYRRFKRKALPPGSKVPKEKTLNALKKELQEVFNEFIRLRDTRYDRGVPYFICISCNKPKPVKQMNAGHFHPVGGNDSVRYNEQNCNGQCIDCNHFKHGNYKGYLRGMLKKYGQNTVDNLEIQRHNRSKLMKFEVSLLIDVYEKKVKELKAK